MLSTSKGCSTYVCVRTVSLTPCCGHFFFSFGPECKNKATGATLPDGDLCVDENCLVGCCVSGQCKLPDPLDLTTEVCYKPKCALTSSYDCSAGADRPDTCATYKCLYNEADGFQYQAGPFDDGCVAVVDSTKCADNNSNDCQTPICSPLTLDCEYINKDQAATCKNGNPLENGCCLYDGTCETDPNVCAYVSRSSFFLVWMHTHMHHAQLTNRMVIF